MTDAIKKPDYSGFSLTFSALAILSMAVMRICVTVMPVASSSALICACVSFGKRTLNCFVVSLILFVVIFRNKHVSVTRQVHGVNLACSKFVGEFYALILLCQWVVGYLDCLWALFCAGVVGAHVSVSFCLISNVKYSV
jgi:hypothetical protein